MGRKQFAVVLMIACTIWPGCLPEKRVVWSRDGSRAMVRAGEDRLVLLEGPKLTPRDAGMPVLGMDWLPDANGAPRAVLLKRHDFTTWESLKANLTPEETRKVLNAAKDLGEQFLAYQGPMDQFKLKDDSLLNDGVCGDAAMLCLHDTATPEVKAKFGSRWGELGEPKAHLAEVTVIDDVAKQANAGRVLDTFLVSGRVVVAADPTGRALALLLPRPELSLADTQPAYALAVCDLTRPKSLTVIDERVGSYVAWSGDGKQLAYFRYVGDPPKVRTADNACRLGDLSVRDISWIDAEGKPAVQAGASRVAGVLFNSLAGLQYTADGNLVFAAVSMTLPATTEEMPQRWTLFRWDPRSPAPVSRMLDSETTEWFAKPSPMWLFAVSPSGRRVLLAGDKDSKNLYLYDSKSGVRVVVEGIEWDEHGVQPTWRNEDQFCAVVVQGDSRGSAKPTGACTLSDRLVRAGQGRIMPEQGLVRGVDQELVGDGVEVGPFPPTRGSSGGRSPLFPEVLLACGLVREEACSGQFTAAAGRPGQRVGTRGEDVAHASETQAGGQSSLQAGLADDRGQRSRLRGAEPCEPAAAHGCAQRRGRGHTRLRHFLAGAGDVRGRRAEGQGGQQTQLLGT